MVGSTAFWNIVVSFVREASCSLPKVEKGAAGAGFWRAWVRSSASCMALSAEETRGTAMLLENKATVSEMIMEFVFGMQISQQR